MTDSPRLSVGIASRGRASSLARCIAALELLDDMLDDVIVVDDGSTEPLEGPVRAALSAHAQRKLRIIRFDPSRGLAAARSTCVYEASSPWVLNLDDDAVVLTAEPMRLALQTISADAGVFAIAFAQAQENGEPWPAGAQPAPVDYPCRVASFIGFAHLVRRDAFVALGGFREQLMINGEEREMCLRALDAGLGVVYLPQARVAHLADPAGRDVRHYLHLTVRNGVVSSIYDDPFALMCVRIPMRLVAYFRMRRGWNVTDPWGFWAVLRWIARDVRRAFAQRRPVRWSTIRRWRSLTRRAPAYRGPA
ncbi:MAG TPA: glycosyltransferase [Gemmatimonadaceae bacterium]